MNWTNISGIVSKKLDAPYKSEQSKAWLKSKIPKRQRQREPSMVHSEIGASWSVLRFDHSFREPATKLSIKDLDVRALTHSRIKLLSQ
jgi:hypothetical protein